MSLLSSVSRLLTFSKTSPRQLTEAIQNGETKTVIELIERKEIDINTLYDGGTPLHHAVYNNKEELVKYLLEKGADVNVKTKFGYDMQDFSFEFDLVDKTAEDISKYKRNAEISNLLKQRRGSKNNGKLKAHNIQSSLVAWNTDDVCEWLHKLGTAFGEYEAIFRENGVDGMYLNILTERDVRDLMQEAKPIHQKRVWQRLCELQQKQNHANEVQFSKAPAAVMDEMKHEFEDTNLLENECLNVLANILEASLVLSFTGLSPKLATSVGYYVVMTNPHSIVFYFNESDVEISDGEKHERKITINLDDLSPGICFTFRIRAVHKHGYKAPFSEPSNQILTHPAPMIKHSEIKVGSQIGTGAFGHIYSGEWKKRSLAIKTLRQRKESIEIRRSFEKEVRVWNDINFPTLLPLLYQCSNPEMLMVMPLCAKGNLTDLMKHESLSWFRKFDIAEQIASGMNYLHIKKILHRDLKGSNILLTASNRVRISDFGLSKSKEISESSLNTKIVGTIAYMAPEVLNQSGYNYHSDVYSYGMVLYELAAQKTPFQGLTLQKVITKLFAVKQRPRIPADCPFGFSVLIQLCWRTNPSERPTFRQILEYMAYQQEQQFPYQSLPSKMSGKPLNQKRDEPALLKLWNKVIFSNIASDEVS